MAVRGRNRDRDRDGTERAKAVEHDIVSVPPADDYVTSPMSPAAPCLWPQSDPA